MNWSDVPSTGRQLETCHAFPGPDEAGEPGRQLRFPSPVADPPDAEDAGTLPRRTKDQERPA